MGPIFSPGRKTVHPDGGYYSEHSLHRGRISEHALEWEDDTVGLLMCRLRTSALSQSRKLLRMVFSFSADLRHPGQLPDLGLYPVLLELWVVYHENLILFLKCARGTIDICFCKRTDYGQNCFVALFLTKSDKVICQF